MVRLGVLSVLCLVVLMSLTGCGEGNIKTYEAEPGGGLSMNGGGAQTEELASNGWTTVKGRITYDGKLPMGAPLAITKDQTVCACDAAKERKDTIDQTWLGKEANGAWGVENVVIFLRPPAGKHFKIHDDYKNLDTTKPKGLVKLDQPFCAYDPHVVVLYPAYSDGKQLIQSGQVFEVNNNATIVHNTVITGDALKQDSQPKFTLSPNGGQEKVPLNPQDTPLTITCDVHPWMKAYAWAFAHPYAARTDAEGNFEIKNVPAGAEVEVVVWHEGLSGGFLNGQGFSGKSGKKMTFTAGEPVDLSLKIK